MSTVETLFYSIIGIVVITAVLSLSLVFTWNTVVPVVVGLVFPGTVLSTLAFFWDAIYITLAIMLWTTIVEVGIRIVTTGRTNEQIPHN